MSGGLDPYARTVCTGNLPRNRSEWESACVRVCVRVVCDQLRMARTVRCIAFALRVIPGWIEGMETWRHGGMEAWKRWRWSLHGMEVRMDDTKYSTLRGNCNKLINGIIHDFHVMMQFDAIREGFGIRWV